MSDLTTINIKDEVYAKRPVLKQIEQEFGNLKLRIYVRSAWEIPVKSPDKNFCEIVLSFLRRIYGVDIAEKVKIQLFVKPLVSTIDHLGIWGHPIFVNADLIYSLYFSKNEYAVSFATESVSLNNTSSWSGSVLLHGDDGGLRRYSFFPDRLKTLPVFSTPAITTESILKFKKNFGQGAENIINTLKIDVVQKIFPSQACLASFSLWQKVFPSAPKFIYLPLESIILEYIKSILHDGENIINKLITTSMGRGLWQKYFGQEHTFMFWGIDARGRRVILENLPKSDVLLEFMEARKVYPSSPLCFVVLLLCGFACVGGFTQTTWLTQVKEKFVSLLKELQGENDGRSPNLEDIPTKNFAESSLAHLILGGRQVKPTSLDLFLTGKDYYADYVKKAQSLTLAESLDLAMPEIYEVVSKSRNLD